MLNNDYGEVYHVKWIVYSIVKAKMWFLGKGMTCLKGKMQAMCDMPHLDKKEGEFYMNKKCGHTKNEVTYCQ